MLDQNSVIAMFDQHAPAEEAVRHLQRAGIGMKELSIVGKDYHTEEHVVGYYSMGDTMKSWGKFGAFWGGIWGLLIGSAMLAVPGLGYLYLAGWIVSGLEGAVLGGAAAALGGALASIGVPQDSVVKYETALKAGHFLVIVHGTPEETERAKGLLATAQPTDVDTHAAPPVQVA